MSLLRTRLALGLLLATLIIPAAAAQNTRFGLNLGANIQGLQPAKDGPDFLIGLNAQVGIELGEKSVFGNISADLYAFQDKMSTTHLEVALLLPYTTGSLSFYAGGGTAIQFQRFDVPTGANLIDSRTQVGLAFKAGVVIGSDTSGMRPFFEVGQTLGAGTTSVVRGGVFFPIGG